ncbi:MAG TPA: TetR/AcrR family transcriptional regulator [Solirubrobacteraceae bacterium]|jgi:AcrR family transcriptional regulator|nr:TetR/AcrR family transcriptional regulator [Solirubrobacteraceae bacterium]
MSALASLSTRERLLRAATDVVEQGGYGAASVLAVARRSGLATGTLYRHFSSKAELLCEHARDAYERELAAARGADVPDAGTVERIEAMVLTFAERALRRPRLAWALIAEPVHPLVDAERLHYRRRYAGLIAELIAEGVAAGELPAQDAELMAAALVGGVGEALVGPLSPLAGRPPEVEHILHSLRAFIRRALGAP